MSEFTTLRLGDVLSIKHGYAFPGTGFREDPALPTLVTPGNFRVGGGFQDSKPKTFDGEYPDEFRLKPGDLVVTMTDLSKSGDTLGFGAVIPADGKTYLHNQRVGLVQVFDPDRLDPAFAPYVFRTAAYRGWVLGSASGSTVKHTSPGRISSFEAMVPAQVSEQRRIARVLASLDKLAEQERALATNVDDLWRAIVRKAIVGDGERVPLSTLAEFINGKNFTKGASGSGLPVIRTPEVRNGPGVATVRTDAPADPFNVAQPGDILFVWSGTLMATRWCWPTALINQHIFKVEPRSAVPAWLAMFAVEELMDEFLGIAADKATTMGHIRRSDLDREVLVPRRSTWQQLDRVVRPMWDDALGARVHAGALCSVRDDLLPLLMSGRVRAGKPEATAWPE